MLDFLRSAVFASEINLQRPSKQLQQHLKTRLGNRRIVAPLAQLVPDERMLRPGELMEAKDDAGFA